jgi:hypothetical protein
VTNIIPTRRRRKHARLLNGIISRKSGSRISSNQITVAEISNNISAIGAVPSVWAIAGLTDYAAVDMRVKLVVLESEGTGEVGDFLAGHGKLDGGGTSWW